jgi:hypothetical protein
MLKQSIKRFFRENPEAEMTIASLQAHTYTPTTVRYAAAPYVSTLMKELCDENILERRQASIGLQYIYKLKSHFPAKEEYQ